MGLTITDPLTQTTSTFQYQMITGTSNLRCETCGEAMMINFPIVQTVCSIDGQPTDEFNPVEMADAVRQASVIAVRNLATTVCPNPACERDEPL